jgi:methyltransferase (TIGR00027 family)
MNDRYRGYLFPCLFIIACSLTTLTVTPAIAAQLGDIPVTAEFSAGLRAIAAMDPDEKIRNPDYIARQFLTPAFWFWSPLSEDFEKSKELINFYRMGGYYTSNACTKHIDAILKASSGRGLKQVVNIGAGLDSRPYRFQEQMPAIRFFEVDMPATVARKKELVGAAFGQLPENVAYVPVDYRSREIGRALRQAGYDEKGKTLFVWEGVTPYIDAASVDRTLQFIADHATPGSELVFDYIPDDVTRGDYQKYPGARFQAVRMTGLGHPWKFGIAQDKAGEFADSHGFSVISDLGADDLAQRYLVRSDGTIDGKPTAFVRIMHAVVNE